MSDGKYQDLITIKNGGSESKLLKSSVINKSDNYFKMEGAEVFSKAVESMSGSVKEILARNKLDIKDINLLVSHQANIRIINILSDLLGIEKEKILISLDEYGNTSSASIPLTLAKGYIDETIKPNDKIVITAFGGGLTWGAGLLQWPVGKLNSKIIKIK